VRFLGAVDPHGPGRIRSPFFFERKCTMKKFFSLMVIATMCVSFVGCGETKKDVKKDTTETTKTTEETKK
jgi:hypothetical protein